MSGICQGTASCQDDAYCAGGGGDVCHQQRFFCVECDGRPGQCPAGMGCQFDFTCAAVGGNPAADVCEGSCADRSACAEDQVCLDGQCCAPPRRCRSVEDCPRSTPECNGATGQCFGGDGCFSDPECKEQTGCAGGQCQCDLAQGAPGSCRLRPDECAADSDCWQGGAFAQKVCVTQRSPRLCADAPTCGSDADCRAEGWVCDLESASPSFGFCQNGTPCTPDGAECVGDAVCDNGVCRPPNCLNTPSLCAADEICDTLTGSCMPRQGGACAVDGDCAAGFYCNATVGICEVGCRENSECDPGICNALHQCEYPVGQFCGPCTINADCPASSDCVDVPLVGQICLEQCLPFINIGCSDPTQECVLAYCNCF